ncbi:AraC family transcriptional regulator, partial [Escherichia coli]|nr:AraC family transcriptional regulator [Escherichia coli]
AGDVVVYDTRVPYLFGFLTPMRQLLIDIPVTSFDDRLDAELAALPLRIAPKPGAGAMLGATLRASVERFMKAPV